MVSGNTIIFNGMCSDHPGFTETGDVTVVLREADESDATAMWHREGIRLKTSITISLTEALLGCTKVLQGHPGFSKGLPIEIPAGTQNMWTGTMPNLGMPVRGTPKFGEAYITVLVIPTAEELAIVKSQHDHFITIFPFLPKPIDIGEEPKVGRWGAI
jgi:DnaJ-class molecular chaperone